MSEYINQNRRPLPEEGVGLTAVKGEGMYTASEAAIVQAVETLAVRGTGEGIVGVLGSGVGTVSVHGEALLTGSDGAIVQAVETLAVRGQGASIVGVLSSGPGIVAITAEATATGSDSPTVEAEATIAVGGPAVGEVIGAEPTADLVLSQGTGTPCGDLTGNTICADGSGSTDPGGSITDYEFQWGDGNTTSGPSAQQMHTYSSSGTYTVTLTVTDDDGNTDSTQKDIFVNTDPTADLTLSTTTLLVEADGSGSSDPDGSITNYAFDWGDGASTSGSNATPSHTYGSAGAYDVQLTVEDNEGATDSVTVTAQPIVATVTVSAVNGLTVDVDATGSNGNVTQYDYDWGDGQADTAAGATPSHTYNTGGSYQIELTAHSATGTDVALVTVDVVEADLVAASVDALTVEWDASGSVGPSGEQLEYRFDWTNDGSYDTGWITDATPSHTYASGGSKTAKVQVREPGGNTNTATATTTVNEPPNAVLDVTVGSGTPCGDMGVNEVCADATASDAPGGTISSYDYEWSASGQETLNGSSLETHTYPAAGTYTVTLTITDSNGNTDQDTDTVTVNRPPVADVVVDSTDELTVNVDASGSSDPDAHPVEEYRFDWTDDGTYDTGWMTSATASHTYGSLGFYTIRVQVRDPEGATDTDTTGVQVSEAPTAVLSTSKAAGERTIEADGSGSTDDSTITQYDYDWGDGQSSPDAGTTAQHQYDDPGQYTVTLTVHDDTGNSDSTEKTVTVNEPPTAVLTTTTDDLTVNGDATGTTDDGPYANLQFDWDWGDGNTDPAAGDQASHTYNSAGTYTVQVTVTDTLGASDSDSEQVDVAPFQIDSTSATVDIGTNQFSWSANWSAGASPYTVTVYDDSAKTTTIDQQTGIATTSASNGGIDATPVSGNNVYIEVTDDDGDTLTEQTPINFV